MLPGSSWTLRIPKLLAAGSGTGPRTGPAGSLPGGDQRTAKWRSIGLIRALSAVASSRGSASWSNAPEPAARRSSPAIRAPSLASKYDASMVAATRSDTSRGGSAASNGAGNRAQAQSSKAAHRDIGLAPLVGRPILRRPRRRPQCPKSWIRARLPILHAWLTPATRTLNNRFAKVCAPAPRGHCRRRNMSNEPRDLNRDPVTGAPGAHPVGVGVGGTGGAVAGAAVGSIFGPIGTLVGGAVGAIAGAAAGKQVAERLDPTGEAEYWRVEYANRPYTDANFDYDSDYAPAYRYGLEVREQSGSRRWDDHLEAEVRGGWEASRGSSRLTWEQARDAVKD